MKKLHFILMGALATSLLGVSSVSATESIQQENDKTVFTQEQDRIELFSDTVILNVGQEFKPELYAKAYRNGEEIPYDGHEFVAIQQEVDTSKAGEYQVVYRLHNGETGGHIDKPMTVVVKNTDSIELISDTIVLYVGDVFRPELYAKAYRNGEEIPYDDHEFVAIQQEVDTSKPGEYPVVYRLHNGPAGTHTDKYMTVVVKEKISDDGVVENDKPSTDFDKDDVKKPISKPGTTVTTNKTNKQSSNQVLPKTGETNTVHLMRLSGVTLMSGLYVLNKRKIK